MRFSTLLIIIFFASVIYSQKLPIGYIEYYSNSFNYQKIDTSLVFSDNCDLSVNKQSGRVCLSIRTVPTDSMESFFPKACMLLSNQVFGEFIQSVDVKYTSTEVDSLDGLYIIAGLRDSLNYYCIQLNNQGTKFYRIYKGKKEEVPLSGNFHLPSNSWQKIQIKRDILNRSIEISSGFQKVTAYDANLVMGYTGFGSEGSEVSFDNLTIWAPTSIDRKTDLFSKTKKN